MTTTVGTNRVAKFFSPDPLGYRGGDPNLYRYCFNDPVNNTDPSGLEARPCLPPEVVKDLERLIASLPEPACRRAVDMEIFEAADLVRHFNWAAKFPEESDDAIRAAGAELSKQQRELTQTIERALSARKAELRRVAARAQFIAEKQKTDPEFTKRLLEEAKQFIAETRGAFEKQIAAESNKEYYRKRAKHLYGDDPMNAVSSNYEFFRLAFEIVGDRIEFFWEATDKARQIALVRAIRASVLVYSNYDDRTNFPKRVAAPFRPPITNAEVAAILQRYGTEWSLMRCPGPSILSSGSLTSSQADFTLVLFPAASGLMARVGGATGRQALGRTGADAVLTAGFALTFDVLAEHLGTENVSIAVLAVMAAVLARKSVAISKLWKKPPAKTFDPSTAKVGEKIRGIDPGSLKQGQQHTLDPVRYDSIVNDLKGGIREPIKVTRDGVIKDGHHRARVAADKGLTVDVEVVEGTIRPGTLPIDKIPFRPRVDFPPF